MPKNAGKPLGFLLVPRQWRRLASVIGIAHCALGCQADSPPPMGALPATPNVTIQDVDGQQVRPLRQDDVAATVLVFITTDCPISNAYAPEIQRLAEQYAPLDVVFNLVHVDASVTAEQVRAHALEHGLTARVLLDPEHLLVRAVGATMTPEAAVITKRGEVAYMGRIDNLYAAPGARRRQATMHELADALNAILSDLTAPITRTTAVGCPIPETP